MPSQAVDPDDVDYHFGSLAFQYYVAGRAAVFGRLMPIAGNLFHHAIEMELKAALAKFMALPQLKGLSHKLPRLWNEFKAAYPGASGAPFDAVIAMLDTFEALRYPDSIIVNGAMIQLVLFRDHVERAGPGLGGEPSYVLVLEDIDELFKFVVMTAGKNPNFFTHKLSAEGRELLFRHNRHRHEWEIPPP